MKLYIGRTIAGILLVTAAALLVLEATRTTELWKPAWPLLFASSGMALLGLFAVNRSEVWATIPGFGLLGLALTFLAVYLLPAPKAGAGQEHRRTWTLATAIPLLVLALIIFTARGQLTIDA